MIELQDSKINEYIAENVKSLRQLKDYSQSEFADLLGINRSSMSNLESGKYQISLSKLYQVALTLGVDIFSILPSVDEIGKDTFISDREKLITEQYGDSILTKIAKYIK